MRSIQILFMALVLIATACKNREKASEASSAPTADLPVNPAKQTPPQPIEEAPIGAAESAMTTDEMAVGEETKTMSEEAWEAQQEAQAQNDDRFKPQMAKDTYFKMIKTPCFGHCPVYNFEVKMNGVAILEGIKFFDYLGMYEARFSEAQLEKIQALAEQYGYSDFDHVYDAPVTDLPSVTTALQNRDGMHWVYNRMNAPQALNDFQVEVETILKEVQWRPSEQITD